MAQFPGILENPRESGNPCDRGVSGNPVNPRVPEVFEVSGFHCIPPYSLDPCAFFGSVPKCFWFHLDTCNSHCFDCTIVKIQYLCWPLVSINCYQVEKTRIFMTLVLGVRGNTPQNWKFSFPQTLEKKDIHCHTGCRFFWEAWGGGGGQVQHFLKVESNKLNFLDFIN